MHFLITVGTLSVQVSSASTTPSDRLCLQENFQILAHKETSCPVALDSSVKNHPSSM